MNSSEGKGKLLEQSQVVMCEITRLRMLLTEVTQLGNQLAVMKTIEKAERQFKKAHSELGELKL